MTDMANITPEEERAIREWQKRTGGGCKDILKRQPTLDEAQRAADNALADLRLFISLNSKK